MSGYGGYLDRIKEKYFVMVFATKIVVKTFLVFFCPLQAGCCCWYFGSFVRCTLFTQPCRRALIRRSMHHHYLGQGGS